MLFCIQSPEANGGNRFLSTEDVVFHECGFGHKRLKSRKHVVRSTDRARQGPTFPTPFFEALAMEFVTTRKRTYALATFVFIETDRTFTFFFGKSFGSMADSRDPEKQLRKNVGKSYELCYKCVVGHGIKSDVELLDAPRSIADLEPMRLPASSMNVCDNRVQSVFHCRSDRLPNDVFIYSHHSYEG